MQVIIYGKKNCPNCDKTKMLCEIKSVDYQYHTVGDDISVEALQTRIGHAITSLPQIFLHRENTTRHIGGYDDLRTALA